MNSRILLFAGTTEGRELAEFLERQGVSCYVCVATEYGEQVLENLHTNHRILAGRLDGGAIADLIRKEEIFLVVDATHPYASVVSENIRHACQETGSRYLRLLREEEQIETQCVFVDSVEGAVEYLAEKNGNILAATGSKELKKYTRLENYQKRVFARVLSTVESMEISANLGFQGKNLICMQGPFDEDMNVAMLKYANAKYLVTKESGKTGGFPEKVRAAVRAGAKLVVVGRPQKEEGYSAQEVRRILCQELSVRCKRKIVLAGIGMGNFQNMTEEVLAVCREADILIGAKRMLESVSHLQKNTYQSYQPEEIQTYLKMHPEYEKVVILLSGDPGFYSGAKKLLSCFEKEEIEILSGNSSVVYLCAKLQTSWEDVKFVSLHGRSQNLVGAVRSHPKVFVLTGKKENFQKMCRKLIEYGMEQVILHVGCHLSYPQETILSGTPQELLEQEVTDLAAVLIENPGIISVVTHGIADEEFIRGQIPMTKSEIRSISLSKLKLHKDSIVYDVGAGTGSVSVEMAFQAVDGMVYAVEKKAEAIDLIKKNRRKFGTANLEVIEGSAPEVLESLPAPTHVFIGGSSGKLMEIMKILFRKNPEVRIVINAIAMETVAEALNCIKELSVVDVDIVTVSVGKANKTGAYHMMLGQNPVTIFSCTGCKKA